MGRNLYLLSLLVKLFIINSHSEEMNFTTLDLSFVIVMNQEYCIRSQLCVFPEFLSLPPPIIDVNGSIIIPSFQPIPTAHPLPPGFDDESCCLPCSCDLDRCTLSGMCCPETLDYLPSIEESASKIKIECNYASLKQLVTSETPLGPPVWMFTKCADNFHDDSPTRQKCENPDEFSNWRTKVPVAHIKTNDTFQNVYCAVCNNVLKEHTVYWNPLIQCSKSVMIPSSIDTIFEEVDAVSDCNIVYKLPQIGMQLPTCDIKISQCNATGHWKRYDPVVEAACHAYTAIYNNDYNNIFCFLCNELKENLPLSCEPNPKAGIAFSFSALLKFTSPSEVEMEPASGAEGKCKETQIHDPLKNECRNLSCMPPKALQDGICTDTVDYLTGVHYEAFLKLTPNESDVRVLDLDETISDVWNIYHEYFEGLNVSNRVHEQAMYYQKSINNDSFVKCFVLHCKTYFHIYDELSNIFVNSLLALEQNPNIFVTDNINSSKTFKMTISYYDMTPKNGFTNSSSDTYEEPLWFIDDGPRLASIVPDFIKDTQPILVTKLLGCPLVELDSRAYTIKVIDSTDLYLKEFDTRIGPDRYVLRNASHEMFIRICAEDFISMTKKLQQHKTKSRPTTSFEDGVTPQGILSVVCTCISLLCLLLTLATYSLFKELRTQPGINNMALVICLIAAQALFQFGNNQAASVPERECQVIGVLVHFFWLMVMFWMNICSIHMCRVFASITTVSASKSCFKQTMIYVIYTFVASTVFVLINIIVSLKSSDFKGMGYGGTLCYITDYRMVGYVFAVPVGCVILLNLATFILVVVKIIRMPTIKSDTKHTRNYFAIYAKLSTITGITWIFGFIYFFTESEAVEYIFIIFNATQGVFIFVSFICNKRVLDMYRNTIQTIKSKSEQLESSTSRKKSMDPALTNITTTDDR